MYVEIDVSEIPPSMVLHEPDDFTSFKVTVRGGEHAFVLVESLEQLAGDKAADPEWRRGFEKMLDYAEQHGWMDGGKVRAHIEWPV